MSKKFNFSDEDMESLNVSIFDDFVLSAMESESADDIDDELDDYNPEDEDDCEGCDDCDDCYDSDYDEEIDGDADPAEEEDDDYDDVVECSGLANMMPSIDSLDFSFALEEADNELEKLEKEYDENDDEDDDDDKSDDVPSELENNRIRIKSTNTIFDRDGSFEDDTADDILGLFDNEEDDDDDDFDPEDEDY